MRQRTCCNNLGAVWQEVDLIKFLNNLNRKNNNIEFIILQFNLILRHVYSKSLYYLSFGITYAAF